MSHQESKVLITLHNKTNLWSRHLVFIEIVNCQIDAKCSMDVHSQCNEDLDEINNGKYTMLTVAMDDAIIYEIIKRK